MVGEPSSWPWDSRAGPGRAARGPIDVGKRQAAALVCDFAGELLARPFRFAMNRAGVAELIQRVAVATAGRPVGLVRVGTWAAGQDHQPLLGEGVLPAGWQVVGGQPGPGRAGQRGVAGRRGIKTDALDLVAISDLLRAGQGAQLRPPSPGHGLGWQRGWRTASGG
jgi:transposase